MTRLLQVEYREFRREYTGITPRQQKFSSFRWKIIKCHRHCNHQVALSAKSIPTTKFKQALTTPKGDFSAHLIKSLLTAFSTVGGAHSHHDHYCNMVHMVNDMSQMIPWSCMMISVLTTIHFNPSVHFRNSLMVNNHWSYWLFTYYVSPSPSSTIVIFWPTSLPPCQRLPDLPFVQ